MKILLVNPAPSQIYNNKNILSETLLNLAPTSLSILILASLVPNSYLVRIIDERYERINFDEDYDIIGISCYTYNVLRGYQIADEFRQKGKKVVLGGWHPSSLPSEAKCHADSVVIGEAEEIWPQLLKDFENGKLKPFYKQEHSVDPKIIPMARRDLTYKKIKNASLQATRGCPVGCEFCSLGTMDLIKLFRPRPIENVIEEIESIKQKNIVFNDPSLTIDPKYTKLLFKEMRTFNKKFICDGNINVLSKDDELLKLASEAGCLEWEIGFESVSQQVIKSIGKKTNIVEEYKRGIKKINDYGMDVLGCFIFGFDTDTAKTFTDTIDEINRIKLNKVLFNILTPYPGTRLFSRLERENRILTKDWSKYTGKNVVYKTKNIALEDFLKEYKKITKKFYSPKEMFKRFFRSNKKKMKFSLLTFPSNGFMMRSYYK